MQRLITYCFMAVAASHCGSTSVEPDWETDSRPIVNGITVDPATIPKTGVVRLPGCTGTLVTPYWVLTAGHCLVSPGAQVRLGNDGDPSAPTAVVQSTIPHPNFVPTMANPPNCVDWDAALLLLKTPLFPRNSDGTVWEGYRRDLYRGSIESILDTNSDAYGYGQDENNANSGILRYGQLVVEEIEPSGDYHPRESVLSLDSAGINDDDGINLGDSGGAALTPSYGSPGQHPTYQILTVWACLITGIDEEYEGPPFFDLWGWFDSTIGDDWTQYDYPSRILAATSML